MNQAGELSIILKRRNNAQTGHNNKQLQQHHLPVGLGPQHGATTPHGAKLIKIPKNNGFQNK